MAGTVKSFIIIITLSVILMIGTLMVLFRPPVGNPIPFFDLTPPKTPQQFLNHFELFDQFDWYTDEDFFTGIAYYTKQISDLEQDSPAHLLTLLKRSLCYLALNQIEEWNADVDYIRAHRRDNFTIEDLGDSFKLVISEESFEPLDQNELFSEFSSFGWTGSFDDITILNERSVLIKKAGFSWLAECSCCQ